MILNYDITTDLSVNTLIDLNKLKKLESESNIKINVSDLSRKLGVDRRTARKYIDGYTKPEVRNRPTQFDEFYPIIEDLLSSPTKVFAYKSILWMYLVDNYELKAPESSFRRYINTVPNFKEYFLHKYSRSVKEPSPMRFEATVGEQAQVDWKESIPFTLSSGERIVVNIFVILLSYSRFRVYRLSIEKTQDILCNFITESLEIIGAVPHEILFDNMRTVMDESRTQYRPGIVNTRFKQFADDFGFRVRPCIAGRPQTKEKVESPMRILDEIKAYNGDLSYQELALKLKEINDRENSRHHKAYQSIPILALSKEKDALLTLPAESIRRQYKIKTSNVKVNKSSMITVQSRQYSVPPKHVGKRLTVQCFDNQIHVYYNTQLVHNT